jgi:hypothetical protein
MYIGNTTSVLSAAFLPSGVVLTGAMARQGAVLLYDRLQLLLRYISVVAFLARAAHTACSAQPSCQAGWCSQVRTGVHAVGWQRALWKAILPYDRLQLLLEYRSVVIFCLYIGSMTSVLSAAFLPSGVVLTGAGD